MIAALAALLLAGAVDARADQMWQEDRAMLERAGFTEPMFRAFYLWTEGQYHLGYCDAHLRASDVAFWRVWWEDTAVVQSEIGRSLLRTATEIYNEGLADGEREQPSQELCRRTADSWMRDIERQARDVAAGNRR